MRRRKFLALTVFGVGAGVVGCGRSPELVRLASGEVGGFYHAFAELLAAVAREEGTVRIEPVTTTGSQENLGMLANGQVDAALALADSVQSERAPLVALGRVYENYLQLAVRSEGPIQQVTDLRGTRVNLGAAGSGAAVTGERLLWAAGVNPVSDVDISHRPLRDAVAGVESGELDALLWAGGVPTDALDVPQRLRLVELGELAAPMRERFGHLYDLVEIPADAYDSGRSVRTVGVANLLLAAPTMSDAAAGAIVDLLVSRADRLVPAEAAGTQFLDTRSLIGTDAVPLHPGAAAVYRRRHG
ncbi:TAXI family TRAP transporter solute-binding subunit [Nocardia pseudovaccinii]|uniref:TAXI family TRAP transporter solute-binding subunit n=1 Tax=Nocardia pseudovaccinii TaxID=189540 RepID=UPI0007A44BA1|nr:TAXI family TRAP transporter solute-binding subunit [Nocardia pseudovaccinii]